MKTKFNLLLLISSIFFLLTSCSTKKNTWLSRHYQALNVRYNIYFNGNESYKQGLLSIEKAHIDDYSEILLMYPVSYHPNANAASSDMARAVEKSKKAIKNRSIKKKPKKNPKKAKDPEYQSFLNKEEYNVMIDDCWLLMGKAEFHKADFLSAVGTFTYITKHFSENKQTVAEAQMWLVRTYAEMAWYYEAEDILNKINKDDLSKKQTSFFAAVNADLMLKQKKYDDAIPFLVLALEGEKNRKQKSRFQYILGQLYQRKGDDAAAFLMYRSVVRSNPAFEMAFNAKIKQAESFNGENKSEMLKMLNKMLRDSKNTDYIDQIYVAIGNIYKEEKNIPKAIENYELAVKKSTRNGYEKAQAYILLADLHYKLENYLEAAPNYTEAVVLMNAQSSDFLRVNKLAETLSDLNKNVQMVQLQDSLQMLSKLPEKQKMEKIQTIIKQVIEEEKKAKEKEEEEKRLAESTFGSETRSSEMASNMAMSLGANRNTAFYFYNTQLMSVGKIDFQKKWGTRRLEDNWRRQVKTLVPNEFISETSEKDVDDENSESSDKEKESNKTPQFYLQQLFSTPEQFDNSDQEIKNALFHIGFLYAENIGNITKSIEVFDELEKRFPSNEKLPDVYFYLYRYFAKTSEKQKSDEYRAKLIKQFPDNKYAKILSQPDYEEKLLKMNLLQDSIYAKTYDAYLANNYQQVFQNYAYMEKFFPASSLMPKFLFLQSLSIAKTEKPEVFKQSLEQLLIKYPESDVSPMAKDMLALMAQGKESKKGDSHGGLIALREKETQQESKQIADAREFQSDLNEKHFFVIAIPQNRLDINKLQYNIAAYNFSKFLIKEFDIEQKQYNENLMFVLVKSMENIEEAHWYQNGVLSDKYLNQEIQNNDLTYFVISENNYDLIFNTFTFKDYVDYFNKNIAKNESQGITDKTNLPFVKKIQPQIIPPTIVEKEQTPANVVSTKQTQVQQQSPKTPTNVAPIETPMPPSTQVQEKKERPKFRGLYAYEAEEKHYLAFYVVRGDFDFAALKQGLDKYNSTQYPLLNLQISLDDSTKPQIVLVGMLPDALSAKSYLLNLVKDRTLFVPFGQAEYRNIVITKENLDVLKRMGNPSVYLDFMKEMYLK